MGGATGAEATGDFMGKSGSRELGLKMGLPHISRSLSQTTHFPSETS